MLVKYSDSKKQIAMGLLSTFDDFNSLDMVSMVIKRFNQGNREIYLERKNGTYIGIVLIIFAKNAVVVDRLALITSENTLDNKLEILSSLASIYPDLRVMGNLSNSDLISKFEAEQTNETTNI